VTLLERAGGNARSTTSPEPAASLRPWLIAWLGLPVLGIANGVVREATYKRVVGERAAHQLSTATLLGFMSGYIELLQRRWPIGTSRGALTIGGSWAVLTVLFEFGFGHYIAGASWTTLLRDYNVADGRVWGAVPLWSMLGPEVIRQLHLQRAHVFSGD
jgi:hypothetical protein